MKRRFRWLSLLKSRASSVKAQLQHGKGNDGYCPICEKTVYFQIVGPWLRDQYKCDTCGSIPRWRALMHTIQDLYPDWRQKRIHESSPGGPLSQKLSGECANYVGTHYFPDAQRGSTVKGYRCEDITRQTFEDETFDLVVTSDVFEHVFSAEEGFREISRTLKPGGAHIFSVPWYKGKSTLIRARRSNDGSIEHLEEPDYHGNPIDASGSLVVTEWGNELLTTISKATDMPTLVFRTIDRQLGLDGEFMEIFVCRKPQHCPEI